MSWKLHTANQYKSFELGFTEDGKKLPLQPGELYVKEIVRQEEKHTKKYLPPLYETLLNKQKQIYTDEVSENHEKEDSIYK